MSASKDTYLPYYRYTKIFDEPGEISCESGHPKPWCGGSGARESCVSGAHVTGNILLLSLQARGAKR